MSFNPYTIIPGTSSLLVLALGTITYSRKTSERLIKAFYLASIALSVWLATLLVLLKSAPATLVFNAQIGCLYLGAAVVALFFAIPPRRTFVISAVLPRAWRYSFLAAILTVGYLSLLHLTERSLHGMPGLHFLLASLGVGFLVTLGFIPLKERLQSGLDRIFFRGTPAALADQNHRLRRQLIQTERLKVAAALSAGVAHEIKNPLTAIKTFTEFMDKKWEDAMYRKQFQRIVGGEVNRIQHIVQQLLEYSRPQAAEKEPVCLAEIADETLELLSARLVQGRVRVERRYGVPGRMVADAKQLKQVFLNLALNSAEAMPDGGRLIFAIDVFGPDLVVTVSDTGNGIRGEDIDHVFDPFFSSKERGSGLGLPVVQTIVQEHGGEIEVHSDYGIGTTVEIIFPAVHPADSLDIPEGVPVGADLEWASR